ncbi:MAG: hypothetical protein LBF09_04590 [Odoribacteraceae bacterium]|jgi:hypothetical protein|nr:hypothetical protein [Odoribacteraceae bacterium]
MKRVLLVAVVVALSVATRASARDEGTPRANVLVIGLERESITSNYYHDRLIAEMIEVPVDSLAGYFNRAIVSRLPDASRGPARFICREGLSRRDVLPAGTCYEGEEERARGDLSRVSPDSLASLLDAFDADFLLLVSLYYMKQESEPFPYLFHIVNYEVYDHHKVKRYEGSARFHTTGLLPAPRLDKYYKKITSQIISQVNRVIQQ